MAIQINCPHAKGIQVSPVIQAEAIFMRFKKCRDVQMWVISGRNRFNLTNNSVNYFDIFANCQEAYTEPQ